MQRFLIFLLFSLLATSVSAQRDTSAEVVTTEAADGLVLVGEFYASDDSATAILLLHMLNSRRSAWSPLIPALTDAGYNVLAVDMRGHGDTGGAQDWAAAERDIEAWLDWLADQPSAEGEQIAIVGASIGSNLALIGCAYDARCVTAIALSPGLDYRGVMPEAALAEGLADRSALLVASHDDSYSADSVKALTEIAEGALGVHLYTGRLHGTDIFTTEADSLTSLVMNWLSLHLGAA
jgi:pimeloyl-ACP methyl ester carboxylesterase